MDQIMKMLMKCACVFTAMTAMLGNVANAAEGYIVVERFSTKVLFASNTEQKMEIGNFCQIATAKIGIDWAKASGTSMATMMVVPNGITHTKNPLQLLPGDQLSLRDAIYSVSMANDEVSAMVLADFIGRKLLIHRGKSGSSIAAFVKEMNEMGRSFKLKKTKFKSPAGGAGMTTVSDLARLASGVVATRSYAFYVNQKSRKLTVLRATGASEKLTVVNTNKFIGKQRVSGLMVVGANAVLSADRKPFVQKLADGGSRLTPAQLIVISTESTNTKARVNELIKESWKLYDNWRAAGYPATKSGKEYLR